jgi:hypothetical protein
MTAEQGERIQEPMAVTGDFQDPHEPWFAGSAGRSGNPLPSTGRVIAERDWGRCAVVRFVRDVETAAPFDEAPTRYRSGDRMRLWQCGRKGRPVDRRFWHTSLDIDDMHFIPAEAVEVIEILEDTPPSGSAPFNDSGALRWWLATGPGFGADQAS